MNTDNGEPFVRTLVLMTGVNGIPTCVNPPLQSINTIINYSTTVHNQIYRYTEKIEITWTREVSVVAH